ncbi:MAG TPA: hypothetical protein VF338_02900, partial [Leptolinea sp.]
PGWLAVAGTPLAVASYKPGSMAEMSNFIWRVRARDAAGNWGVWSGTRGIKILPVKLIIPTLISPATGLITSDNTPTFTWSPVAGAAVYQLQFNTSPTFPPSFRQTSALSWTETTPITPDGVYYWHVRAVNPVETGTWSATNTFTIDTTGPVAPLLVLPADNAETNIAKPAFSWQTSLTATRYQLEYDIDSGFANPISSGVLSTTSYTPTIALTGNTTYYWHVKAQDALGNWGGWSATRTIIIDTTPPAAPALVLPESGLVTNDTTPDFSWSLSSTAFRYQVRYATNSAFTSAILSGELATPNFTPATLTANIYYWQARARDLAGNWSAWSDSRIITIDITPPPVPVLISPSNGATSIYPTFAWGVSTGAVGYQIQFDRQSTFTAPIDYTAPEDSTSHTPAMLIPAGTYYWHVRAIDEAGNWSAWSAARTIIVPG